MKNKNATTHSEAQENRLIRKDMNHVIVLNLILLALMISLFFWNKSSGSIESLLGGIFKF